MPKFHLPTIEEEVLQRWEDKDVFRRLIQEREKASVGRFVFFEGPPTANGKPGLHHMLTRSFKDVILRYWTMRGYRIDRKAGWDTHGLPVELEVEKQLGFTKKQDIEDYGIAPFNAKCRESVWKYRDLWEKMTRRTAFWVDLEHPYVTYENNYVESLWNIMKKVEKDGRLYHGYRVTPHCPRCVTSLSSHELAQGYKDVEDPSVFIKFRVKGETNKFLLVWTTTPWTLPANVAIAAGENVDYIEAKLAATGETFILARALTSVLDGEFETIKEMKGSELVGLEYDNLYSPFFSAADSEKVDRAYKVYPADFVSTADGTGLVHIAPAFGPDDAELGKTYVLPTLITVSMTGMMRYGVPGEGKFFKKADADIMADLTARGLLYKSGVVKHTYPFCWRCDTPLLYIAKSSWYIRMSELRDRLLALNDGINWVPDNMKEGRFGEWLREVKDWAISRERYWGTPMPLWLCETGGCDARTAIGSLAELDERKPAMNRVFMMRHGQAETNATTTIISLPEPRPYSLTELGREEVKKAATELKEALGGKAIDAIYCSPLTRTRETAAQIAAALGFDAAKIEYRDELQEIVFGELNGKQEAEYHACFKDVKERFAHGVPGGESLTEVRRRAVAFVKGLRYAEATGKNILVITHGDSLWLAKTGFDGLSDDETIAADYYPKTGSLLELTNLHNLPYDQDGHVDVHRPYIDEVKLKCEKCGGHMTRVKEVLDCWFDSGAMPYAQWHYPFENVERIDGGSNYPADFISEAIDQTRGWFYTLLAVAALMDKTEAPYKNVISLGHVLDAKGKKMSKSTGNVVDPFEAVNKLGADAIRYYFFTLNQPGEYKRFDEKGVEEVTKKVFMILWNVLSFYQMFATEGSAARLRRPPEPQHVLDEWVLSETAALVAKVGGDFQNYDVIDAGRAVSEFVNDLSTWYVRRSRDRFKGESAAERESAIATLGYVLFTLARVMAPFTPFLADALYKELGGELDSVHLDRWPEGDELPAFNARLREDMASVRAVVSLGQEQRAKTAIPVRQALAKATVRSSRAWAPWALAIVAEELNVHEAVAEETAAALPTEVELDTIITPALRREGAARELVRNLNDWRKQSGLTIKDRIVVTWRGGAFWQLTMHEFGAAIAAGTLCDSFVEGASLEGIEPVTLVAEDDVIDLWAAKV
jgi:isoleucyl-tRNA synthetase